MKTLIAALMVTAGMNANADVFRPWGDVASNEAYVVNEELRQAHVGFQPWSNDGQAKESYTTDERVAAEFRKGIGFQPFSQG